MTVTTLKSLAKKDTASASEFGAKLDFGQARRLAEARERLPLHHALRRPAVQL